MIRFVRKPSQKSETRTSSDTVSRCSSSTCQFQVKSEASRASDRSTRHTRVPGAGFPASRSGGRSKSEWRNLCSDYADPLPLEGGKRFGGSTGVRNQYVDFIERTNEGGTDLAKLARVGRDDDLFRLLNHLSQYERFIGLQSGHSAIGVQTSYAEKHLVHVDVVQEGQRCVARTREGPGPGNHTASETGADAGLIAQFHADIHGVRDHPSLVAVAQAATDVCRRGTRRQAHSVIVLNKFCGCQANAPLFLGKPLLAREE